MKRIIIFILSSILIFTMIPFNVLGEQISIPLKPKGTVLATIEKGETYEFVNNSDSDLFLGSASSMSMVDYIVYESDGTEYSSDLNEIFETIQLRVNSKGKIVMTLKHGSSINIIGDSSAFTVRKLENPAYIEIEINAGETYEFINDSEATRWIRYISDGAIMDSISYIENSDKLGSVQNINENIQIDCFNINGKERVIVTLKKGSAFFAGDYRAFKIRKLNAPAVFSVELNAGESYDFINNSQYDASISVIGNGDIFSFVWYYSNGKEKISYDDIVVKSKFLTPVFSNERVKIKVKNGKVLAGIDYLALENKSKRDVIDEVKTEQGFIYDQQKTDIILPIEKLTEVKNEIAENKTVLDIYDFKDIPLTHWGITPIRWGLTEKLVGGYPDGTFKPDKTLSESEFVAMFARYASNTDKEAIKAPVDLTEHWSQYYYDELYKFNLPLRGYTSNELKDTNISRGQIAMIIAANYGFNLNEEQAIYFMYENELSNGMKSNVRTVESYGADKPLTRVEALQFLLNIKEHQLKQVKFMNELSMKGDVANEREILGIVDVTPSTKKVYFSDYGVIITKIVDGKVVVEMNKITEPVSVPGNKYDKVVNYIDFTNEQGVDAAVMNNSIILYKGVELPLSDGFKLGSELLISDDGQRHGIVGLEIDGNGWKQTGSFTDKKVFIELLSNLKFFQTSPNQIAKAKEVVGSKYGIHNERDNTTITDYTSSIKNSTMRITYGDGTVDVAIYNGVGILNSADSIVKLD